MSDNPVEQVLSDLFRYLEVLETQNGAMLQLLKDKKIVSDKKFAPYLEQAATISEVKWRAARTRMEHLFAAMPEPTKAAEPAKKEVPKKEQSQAETQEDRQVKTRPQPEKEQEQGKGAAPAADSRPKEAADDRPNSEKPSPEASAPQPKAPSDSKSKDAPKEPAASQKTAQPAEPAATTRAQEASTPKTEAAHTRKPAEVKESGQDKDAKRSAQHPPASKEAAEVQPGKNTRPQPQPQPVKDTEKEAA